MTQNVPDVCNIKFRLFIRTLFCAVCHPLRIPEKVRKREPEEECACKRYPRLLAGLVHRVCAAG